MEIHCENIGILKKADVTLDSITVIAGLNATGKSTIGKLLYCISNGFYKFDEQVREYLEKSIRRLFDFDILENKTVQELFNLRNQHGNVDEIKRILNNAQHDMSDDLPDEWKKRIIDDIAADFSQTDEQIVNTMLQNRLRPEFGGQIQNINDTEGDSFATFEYHDIKTDKDVKLRLNFEKDLVSAGKNLQKSPMGAIYIDDPLIIENLNFRGHIRFQVRGHRRFLLENLKDIDFSDNVEAAMKQNAKRKKIENVLAKINKICPGDVASMSGRYVYLFDDGKKYFTLENMSAGLKVVAIIKKIIMNGILDDDDILILDEPEIHLHPQWQEYLAEIIVLFQQEVGLHVLINSHSPYFIRAIEIYSRKYEIDDARFYLSEKDGNSAAMKDVTKNTDPIYALLARPLQDLENVRSEIAEREMR